MDFSLFEYLKDLHQSGFPLRLGLIFLTLYLVDNIDAFLDL